MDNNARVVSTGSTFTAFPDGKEGEHTGLMRMKCNAMHQSASYLTEWLVLLGSCLLLRKLPSAATVNKATRDPKTGIITCNYPEEQGCVMPYNETNTT